MRPETTGRAHTFSGRNAQVATENELFATTADERPEDGRVLRQIATRLSSRDESSSSMQAPRTGRVTHFRALDAQVAILNELLQPDVRKKGVFVFLQHISSFKIATCVFARKKADTSR